MEVSEVINNKSIKENRSMNKYIIATKTRSFLYSILRGVIIFGICFVILYPLFVKFTVSLKDEADLYDSSVKFIPKAITFENYRLAWDGMEYPKTFIRTFGLSAGTALLQLVSSLLTAYGFARFKFPGKNLLFGCVILTLIVPPQILMLPLFMEFRFFDMAGVVEAVRGRPINLVDSPWPFFISAATTMGFKNGLYIYMLRQFFKGVPKEQEEAALVDGCGKFRTFLQIILPSAKSMAVTIFLFGFVWQWTDSFYSGLYLPTYKVMSNALSSLAAEVYARYTDFSGFMNFVSPAFVSLMNNTGVILVIVPLVVLYLICQKYFVESIEHSGLVG